MKSFSDILSILGIVLLNLFMMPIPEAQQTITHTGLPENRDIKLIMTWVSNFPHGEVQTHTYMHTNILSLSPYTHPSPPHLPHTIK